MEPLRQNSLAIFRNTAEMSTAISAAHSTRQRHSDRFFGTRAVAMGESTDSDGECRRLIDGGPEALASLVSTYRERLERMVEFRLDPRLRGRVEAADVLQEAYIEMARRVGDYTADPAVSFFVWARQLTYQTLIGIHRRHFSEKRDPNVEIRLGGRPAPSDTSDSIARQLLDERTTPSQAAARAEEVAVLKAALESLDEIDREVLALRHFEQLGNNEVAQTLGLSVTAASNRYVRAMTRLGEIMAKVRTDE
jgi:RNA polymerase sigma-70 factor (ECF subfamily)